MAPLDLDKYAEIAKQCKYLPENDLKVNATLKKCFWLGAYDGNVSSLLFHVVTA